MIQRLSAEKPWEEEEIGGEWERKELRVIISLSVDTKTD